MKKNFTTTFLVLVLTPSFAFAQRPSISDLQEQVATIVVCSPDAPTRFVDNGDGTICDTQTGLMWEQKEGALVGVEDLDNPRNVVNVYSWTSRADGDEDNPDGTAFTDFLARLNGVVASSASSEQLGGYRDWRLPTSAELQTIRDCSFAGVCINPIFGPTFDSFYHSSTSVAGGSGAVWDVNFDAPSVIITLKSGFSRVRAVRGGQ